MKFLPLVVDAEPRGDYRVHLVFNDGVEATVDCEHYLEGPVFKPLREPRYFARVSVDAGALVWPNGADIAPETLYEAATAARSKTARQPTAVRERRPRYKTRPAGKRGRG
jgi:hypothetical protein